jgi:uncharacterized sulfatase
MKKITVYRLILLIFSLLIASLHGAERLNVLLIMADDLRDFGGAFTQNVVKTPNLNRLRARGTSFERAYVQYPVCNPSRSSLLSGLRPEQTGICQNDTFFRHKQPDLITLPQLCKDNGWQSHAFGKIFHLGGKDAAEKKMWMDIGKSWHSAQAFEATNTGKQMLAGRNVTGDQLKWCEWGAAAGNDDDQPDGQIAASTVAMIEKLGETPWFIGCGFMKPHDPFIAPKKYFDLYPPESIKPWHDPADTSPVRKEAVGFGELGTAFGNFTETEWRELFRAYCAGTSFMDAQLGRVLDVLDQKKLWDKTIVIFIGDNGYHTGERKWWNKNTLFERACRAPLIIAAPGMKGSQTTQSLVEFIDLYPTVVDFCGLKSPQELAGKSLRPVLEKPTASIKDSAFTLVTRGKKLYGQSVRTNDWRFTRWSDGKTELYHHKTDPEELHNVADDHAEVITELRAKLQSILKFNP